MPDSLIQQAMARRDLSYRDLGFLTDLDPGYLCRIARGERQPSRETALIIAKVLGINPRALVAETRGAA